MTDTTQTDYDGWIGQPVVNQAGDKIGKVSQIYLDDESGRPEWVAINTGMFSSKSSFAPLEGATAQGDQIVIPYDKDKVKDAPQVEDDGDGHLTPEEERHLYGYYGRQYGETSAAPGGAPTDAPTTTAPTTAPPTEGYDTSGPTTDDAMTRSEERVQVGTQRVEAGRARLRKYVVTEQVTQTVPVTHEEVRVEREPITDANRGQATSGPEISEEEHEVVLHEERPVVQKETVPVERVRLSTENVTEEARVDEQVRKEQIEEEGVEGRPPAAG